MVRGICRIVVTVIARSIPRRTDIIAVITRGTITGTIAIAGITVIRIGRGVITIAVTIAQIAIVGVIRIAIVVGRSAILGIAMRVVVVRGG